MSKTATKQRRQLLLGGLALVLALALLTGAGLCIHHAFSTPSPSQPTQPETTLVPNPYRSGDFLSADGYLTCTAGASRLGVDVSSHQGSIDWVQVKAAGVDFAMIRIGYRGYGNGELKVDERALENLQNATLAGLDVGAYFFSQAIDAEEAEEEARFLLEILDGFSLQLPIAYDWEYISDTARTANVDRDTLNACALAFGATIANAGYSPMAYFNSDLANQMLNLVALQEAGYPFWFASYSQELTCLYRVDFWQYSSTGTVPGISGNVDLNLQLLY